MDIPRLTGRGATCCNGAEPDVPPPKNCRARAASDEEGVLLREDGRCRSCGTQRAVHGYGIKEGLEDEDAPAILRPQMDQSDPKTCEECFKWNISCSLGM